jgi:hypothetical protein
VGGLKCSFVFLPDSQFRLTSTAHVHLLPFGKIPKSNIDARLLLIFHC